MIAEILGQFLAGLFTARVLPTDVSVIEERITLQEEAQAFTYRDIPDSTLIIGPMPPAYPKKVRTESYGIITSAKSFIVEDDASGMMLLGKRPNDLRSIGSVTKVMTALVFLEQNPDLLQRVTIENEDLIYGGRIYVRLRDPLTLRDVLAASLVGSDNTATQALMRFSGLTKEEFIARMNEKAQEFGMHDTAFTDPTGIDAANQSTASDLVKLLKVADRNDTMRSFMTSPSITIAHASGVGVSIENTNHLLGSYLNRAPFGIKGGKTGYLPQAGYVLATTVEQNGKRIHVIVLGSESEQAREDDVQGLAEWTFRTFEWPNL